MLLRPTTCIKVKLLLSFKLKREQPPTLHEKEIPPLRYFGYRLCNFVSGRSEAFAAQVTKYP
jgi:hypothetical protein